MPKLHPKQEEIFADILNDHTAMFFSICTGRQFGKTFLAIQVILYYALKFKNGQIMFCAPVHSQSQKVYKELVKGIDGSGLIQEKNSKENSIILVNGTEIYFKSVKQYENLRTYSIDYMILDEAALYAEVVFNTVLRPMLNVRGKKCIIISTPRSKNWFHAIHSLAQSNERYKAYTAPSASNPYANFEEIEDAKKTLPAGIFRQEYLAEFIEDGSEVFSNYDKCAIVKQYEPSRGVPCYCGIDLGRQDDSTVLYIMNKAGKVLFRYKKNKTSWQTIIDDVVRILKQWRPKNTLVEVNGIGDVTFDMIRKNYHNIKPFVTSNTSKQKIVEQLIYAFETEDIQIPSTELCPELHDEIENFSYTYSPKSRLVQYAAKSGYHDDEIMSLCICNEARKHVGSTQVITI